MFNRYNYNNKELHPSHVHNHYNNNKMIQDVVELSNYNIFITQIYIDLHIKINKFHHSNLLYQILSIFIHLDLFQYLLYY